MIRGDRPALVRKGNPYLSWALGKNSDALRLDRSADLTGQIHQRIQHGLYALSGQGPGIVEGYIRGDLEIILNVAVMPGDANYHLVILPIPSGGGDSDVCVSADDRIIPEIGNSSTNFAGHPVLVWLHRLIEGDECSTATTIEPIPSMVRLERPQARVNFVREMFPQPPIHVASTGGEGEVNEVGLVPGEDANSIAGDLVQDMSHVVQGRSRNMPCAIRDSGIEADLIGLVSVLRVDLNDVCVVARLEHPLANVVKLVDVFLSLRN